MVENDMSKHLRMIWSDKDNPRQEVKIEGSGMMSLGEGFKAHSALFGDGTTRYADVTEQVNTLIEEGATSIGLSDITTPSQAKEVTHDGEGVQAETPPSLRVISAFYGPTGTELDVAEVLRSKIANDSLDLNVTNGELQVGNPFRGIKKLLTVAYSYDNQPPTTITKEEREWLIIGQSARWVKGAQLKDDPVQFVKQFGDELKPTELQLRVIDEISKPLSATALTDYLIRKFQIPSHRLRGPMPIELRDFHRDDLARLFAELGFNRGVEVGVAEANFSEILCKANPNLELLCVDPWHAYSGNPQNKSKEKNEYALNEAKRKLAPYPNVKLDMRYSMDAVRDVSEGSLDFCYIDGHHSYPFVMADIIEWAKRVRSGGIVAGDDVYRLNEKWGAGPMEAIYDYTRAMKIEPWFLINAHKSVDFFFVKQ